MSGAADAMTLAPPGCPLCRAAGTRPAFSKGGYQHFQCPACRTLFVHPVPDGAALADLYQAPSHEPGSALCWSGSGHHLRRTWRRALTLARSLAGPGPLLDVGCGAGQFLVFARSLGWTDLEGLEIAEPAALEARGRSGATVHLAPLEANRLQAGRFAAVTLWDVFEHLARPAEALREVRRLLRPGGIVVVSTPHRHGLALRLRGGRALVVMPPEHLVYPSRAGMRAALGAEGLEIRRAWCLDLHLREWTRHLAAAPEEERAVYIRWYTRLAGSAVFPALAGMANLVLGASRLGDQLVIVAQGR